MHTLTSLHLFVFNNVMSGGSRFIKDIEMMIGTKSVWFWLYWRLCWYFFTPCITLVSALLKYGLKITPNTHDTQNSVSSNSKTVELAAVCLPVPHMTAFNSYKWKSCSWSKLFLSETVTKLCKNTIISQLMKSRKKNIVDESIANI